ncbi:extracelular serine carboxypeptidase-like protein [Pestalotiopsis sp. NC0098]|nr:extracelular serine carboxypeptidase-like protein [Pestalotiopsis sp. NC0098]
MKISVGVAGLVASVLPVLVGARHIKNLPLAPQFEARQAESARPTSYEAYYFDQKIDHFPTSDKYLPHTNDTFKQTYYVDNTYYQSGGPVFLYISGETSGRSRWSNLQTGIIQILMEAFGGLGVIIENRYYGTSYPYNTSTTDELAYLTNEQTVADFAYFAQNAQFAGIDDDLTAPNTPWILYGGSLAGAETAFSIKLHGDVLYGGIASSAPIFLSVGYPDWYDPIQKYAPQDCVTRINNIVDNFDALVDAGNRAAVDKFKSLFNLQSLTDDRDFATAIANPIGNPGFYLANTWQELNWNSSYGSDDFFEFCGNVTDVDAPTNITQVDYTFANYTGGQPWDGLGGYADYIQKYLLPNCPSGDYNSNDCWGTQNASWWADTANSGTRSYIYTSCTEQGAYIAAPESGPSLLSRVVDTPYEQQWCTWAFPDGEFNSIPSTPDLDVLNSLGGFDLRADRLAFIDGDQDVWKDLCFNSDLAPQPRPQSTDLHPHYLITGAGHHWDSYGILDVDAEPQFIREAHKWEIRTVKRWLNGFADWEPES